MSHLAVAALIIPLLHRIGASDENQLQWWRGR